MPRRRGWSRTISLFARITPSRCAMQPENDTIKWERALTYLDMARYKEGWEAFEVHSPDTGKPMYTTNPLLKDEVGSAIKASLETK